MVILHLPNGEKLHRSSRVNYEINVGSMDDLGTSAMDFFNDSSLDTIFSFHMKRVETEVYLSSIRSGYLT